MTPPILEYGAGLLLMAFFTIAQMLIVYLIFEGISRLHYHFRKPRS